MKEYRVFVLTPEGGVLDQHILLCTDDDEARETAKVLADSTPGMERPGSPISV